jgi:hypothetical protein
MTGDLAVNLLSQGLHLNAAAEAVLYEFFTVGFSRDATLGLRPLEK